MATTGTGIGHIEYYEQWGYLWHLLITASRERDAMFIVHKASHARRKPRPYRRKVDYHPFSSTHEGKIRASGTIWRVRCGEALDERS